MAISDTSQATEEDSNARARLRSRVMLVVVLTVFLDLIGFGIMIPLLPEYVTSMGSTVEVVGLILSSYSAAQFLATPVLGSMSDRFGRRSIILFSLVGNAISMLLFALATQQKMIALLFLSRTVAGATAGNLSACQAAIADVTDKSERAGAMGMLGAGIGLGMTAGPLLGGWLHTFGVAAPPVGAAALALLDLVLAAILMPETHPGRLPEPVPQGEMAYRGPQKQAPGKRPSIAEALANRQMAVILALYFLTFVAMSSMNVALPLFGKDRFALEGKDISKLFGLFGVTGLVVQGFLMRRLVKVVTERVLVIVAAVLMAVGMVAISLATSVPMLVAGLFSMAAGVAINNPSLASLASKSAGPDFQGAALGFAQSAGGLARMVGPAWAGMLYGRVAHTAPFVSSAVAACAMLGVVMALGGGEAEVRPAAGGRGAGGAGGGSGREGVSVSVTSGVDRAVRAKP
jgi:MFS family permease